MVQAIRYASAMTLHIELQSDPTNGKILPPYLEITYSTATIEDFDNNKRVSVSSITFVGMHESQNWL